MNLPSAHPDENRNRCGEWRIPATLGATDCFAFGSQ
jgi:hypothetical protein